MSYSRADQAEAVLRLRDNANWRQYVSTLEAHFNDRVSVLLQGPPDETLRGECRALYNLLKNINKGTGEIT